MKVIAKQCDDEILMYEAVIISIQEPMCSLSFQSGEEMICDMDSVRILKNYPFLENIV
jgi:hypothetical protein